MTREEAIEHINIAIDRIWKEKKCNEILDALKQEPCDDCINRQAVINAFWRFDIELKPNAIDVILKMIKDFPPATPAEKTAHWIMHPKGIYAHLVCSNCLSSAPYNCETYYCPKCGRKMEEVKE